MLVICQGRSSKKSFASSFAGPANRQRATLYKAARHTPKKSRAEVCQLRSEGMGNCRLCEPSK